MNPALRLTLLALGAACVLLLAGGFPLLGAEAVYRGGAMILLGVLTALLALVGGWQLAAGQRWRLLGGLVSLFLAAAGVVVAWQFGSMAVQYARQGGVLWMAAIGMGCTGAIGALFVGLFGFFVYRLMNGRLWLSALHLSLVAVAAGSFWDFVAEETVVLDLPVQGAWLSSVRTAQGHEFPLGFSLRVESFHVTHEPGASYSLYYHEDGRISQPQSLEQRGKMLCLGEECWPVESLKTAPGMPRPYLLLPGTPVRLIMQDVPAVRDYCATCTVEEKYKGQSHVRTYELRVNNPLVCNGWQLALLSYQVRGDQTWVTLQARHAPGRYLAMAGMVGLIICTAGWCWGRKERRAL